MPHDMVAVHNLATGAPWRIGATMEAGLRP